MSARSNPLRPPTVPEQARRLALMISSIATAEFFLSGVEHLLWPPGDGTALVRGRGVVGLRHVSNRNPWTSAAPTVKVVYAGLDDPFDVGRLCLTRVLGSLSLVLVVLLLSPWSQVWGHRPAASPA